MYVYMGVCMRALCWLPPFRKITAWYIEIDRLSFCMGFKIYHVHLPFHLHKGLGLACLNNMWHSGTEEELEGSLQKVESQRRRGHLHRVSSLGLGSWQSTGPEGSQCELRFKWQGEHDCLKLMRKLTLTKHPEYWQKLYARRSLLSTQNMLLFLLRSEKVFQRFLSHSFYLFLLHWTTESLGWHWRRIYKFRPARLIIAAFHLFSSSSSSSSSSSPPPPSPLSLIRPFKNYPCNSYGYKTSPTGQLTILSSYPLTQMPGGREVLRSFISLRTVR